jgi:DNA-binding XRE family transcriptional regulator
MAKNAKEVMKRLPVSRRKKIEARAALLIAEEMTLQEMRKARELTQEKLAKSLGINQKQVSAIEKRTDMRSLHCDGRSKRWAGTSRLLSSFPTGSRSHLQASQRPSLNPLPRHPVSVARTRPESSYFPSQM